MKTNNQRYQWTELDCDILRAGYPHLPTAQIAKDMRLSERIIKDKAAKLKIKKSPEYIAELRKQASAKQKATQFKPGQKAWNKGTRFTPGGRSSETQFKKRHKPVNYVPVGGYRLKDNRDGNFYWEKKVTDIFGAKYKNWKMVSHIVWEEANGPIPKGSIIAFKEGMKTNKLEEITIDRLECITRKENALRNNPHLKDKEIGKLYQLKGAIKRQLNKITKGNV